MRAYVGARGPKVGPFHTFGGVSTHVTFSGICVWLMVVGVVELAVVLVELTARLVKLVVVATWRLCDWTLKRIRQHRQATAARLIRQPS